MHPEAHGIESDATRGVDSSIPGKNNQLKITSPVRCDSNFFLIICSLFFVFFSSIITLRTFMDTYTIDASRQI